MSKFDAIQATDVTVPDALGIHVRSNVRSNYAEIGPAIGAAFGMLGAYLGEKGLQCVGPPRVVYLEYGPTGTTFLSVMPIEASPAEPGDGPVNIAPLPSGTAMRFTHIGPYMRIGETYNLITAYMAEKGLIQTEADWINFMPMWEEYISDPDLVPEAELLTYIYLPMKR